MKILAIETSCDETAIALVDYNEPEVTVLDHQVASQIDIHAEYGGVFPNLAKREHARVIAPMIFKSLQKGDVFSEDAYILEGEQKGKLQDLLEREPELFNILTKSLVSHSKPDIDYIAVTVGPGLAPALWVGVNTARALSLAWDIPIIPINHMEGHLVSVFAKGDTFRIDKPSLPAMALLISGGHTEFDIMTDFGEYERVGRTLDDAVGEAYDKVARMMGMSYPGGPKVSKCALDGKSREGLSFPRPMINTSNLDMSFSGLKTAVRYYVEEAGEIDDSHINDICFEFEQAVFEVLSKKLLRAIELHSPTTIIVAGGVANNRKLCEILEKTARSFDSRIKFLFPEREVSTDNALMIAMAACIKAGNPESSTTNIDSLSAHGSFPLGSVC
jgi:N6-L-threonylcarbamoyladenine synthase